MAPDERSVRRRIVDAATALLAKQGPGALSIRRIAAAADVAPMSVYNHFGSKDGVVNELFRNGFETLSAVVTEGIEPVDDPIERLRAGARRYRRFALEHPTAYLVMFARAVPDFVPDDETIEYANSSFSVLVDCVRYAQDRDAIVGGDPVELGQRIWSVMHGAVSLELFDIGFVADREQSYADTIDTLIRGLRK